MAGQAVGLSSASRSTPRHVKVGLVLAFLLIGALLLLQALNATADHDEDQYIAGAALAADAVIFRDFMHLQTPLQALLFAPLAELFPGHVFVAMRIVNALTAIATLAVLFAAMRMAGASDRAACIATVLFAFCPPLQQGATIVRNDIVPSLFSSLGMLWGIRAARNMGRAPWPWLLAGLCFGLAASAKISHAFLAAGAGLFLLLRWMRFPHDRRPAADLLAFGGGGLAGLIPSIVTFAGAPQAFLWGVVGYAATAPFDWYRLNGLERMLTLTGTAERTLAYLGRSPALPALILLLVLTARRRAAPRAEVLLLDVLIVAGAVAAILPTPSWPYYYLTLLLPLFVRLSLEIDGIFALRPPARAVILVIFAISLASTINWQMRHRIMTAFDGLEATKVEAEAHWIGERLRAAGAAGAIATLSPRLAIDSGYPLDRRFATGVFVYRSGNLLDAAEHRRFNTVGPRTLAAALDSQPPAAIITGYENGSGRFRVAVDPGLRAYALARGYRLERSPVGAAQLYINPRSILVNRNPESRHERSQLAPA